MSRSNRFLLPAFLTGALGALGACGGDSTAPQPTPSVASISPATLLPNSIVTITGANFDVVAANNTVTVDGVAIPITTASANTLTLDLTGAPHGFPCHDPKPVAIVVKRGARADTAFATLDPITTLDLAAGQSQFFDSFSGSSSSCLRLPAHAGSSYLFTVYNVGSDPTLQETYSLGGTAAAALTASRVAVPTLAFHGGSTIAAISTSANDGRDRVAEAAAHHAVLERNRRIVAARGGPAGVHASIAALRRHVNAAAVTFAPQVNDTVDLRVDNINVDTDCTAGTTQRARVVYVSNKTIVYEDLANSVAGQLDTAIQSIATEFDNITLPLETANFGDPLALDPMLGNKGHVLIFFTSKVNSFSSNLLGFVNSCDFFPFDTTTGATRDTVTNEAPIFYAYVPIIGGTGFKSISGWHDLIRAVLPHETKHIVSYAEKVSRNADNWEEHWLEESTAQIASEIYQRNFSGQTWKGNGQWATTVGCEPPVPNNCGGDHPKVLLEHFSWLNDYYSNLDFFAPTLDDPVVYYGGGWSFVRWAVDQYATTEPSMLKAITQTTHVFGAANLSATAGGIPFSELSSRWMMASALAPYRIAPADAKLTMPSWDFAGIFAGLNASFPNFFMNPFPLLPAETNFGPSFPRAGSVLGGGSSVIHLSGDQTTSQLVALQALDGSILPAGSNLRLGVVRVH